jgi:hypothetical protein
MNTYEKVAIILPSLLTSALEGGVSGQLHAQVASPPGKKASGTPWIPAGRAQIQSGRCGEEKNLLSFAGNRTPAV